MIRHHLYIMVSESFTSSGWSLLELEIHYRHDDGLTDNHLLLCYMEILSHFINIRAAVNRYRSRSTVGREWSSKCSCIQ